MAILALDVGSKRIGVAVSDPDESMALPIGTIERAHVDDDLARVIEYARSYACDEIVVGDPIALSGERGIAARKIDRFVERLREVFAGPIHRIDERLTTAQATRTLLAADVSRRRRKEVIDKMAAALILDSFLSRRRVT